MYINITIVFNIVINSMESEEFKSIIYRSKKGQHSLFVPSYIFKYKLEFKEGKEYLIKITEIDQQEDEN